MLIADSPVLPLWLPVHKSHIFINCVYSSPIL